MWDKFASSTSSYRYDTGSSYKEFGELGMELLENSGKDSSDTALNKEVNKKRFSSSQDSRLPSFTF